MLASCVRSKRSPTRSRSTSPTPRMATLSMRRATTATLRARLAAFTLQQPEETRLETCTSWPGSLRPEQEARPSLSLLSARSCRARSRLGAIGELLAVSRSDGTAALHASCGSQEHRRGHTFFLLLFLVHGSKGKWALVRVDGQHSHAAALARVRALPVK